jgi:hypothetical protein
MFLMLAVWNSWQIILPILNRLTRLWTYRDFLQLFFEYGEAVQTCLKEALSSLFCPFFALINDSMAFPFRLRLAFFTAFALYL